MLGDFFISAEDLGHRLAMAEPVRIFDVRRPAAITPQSRFLPGSRWRAHLDVRNWASGLGRSDLIVLNCLHGHNVSQAATTLLRELGYNARALAGGVDGWVEAGLPTVGHSRMCPPESRPGIWVTGIEATIDSVACPWLISRFIDPDAVFHFVESDWVSDIAEELAGISFAVPDALISSHDGLCSFDTVLREFDLNDPALEHLALIVRAAGTCRPDLAPEAAGILSIMHGQSILGRTAHHRLQLGFPVYDALYARLKLANGTTRGRQPLSN